MAASYANTTTITPLRNTQNICRMFAALTIRLLRANSPDTTEESQGNPLSRNASSVPCLSVCAWASGEGSSSLDEEGTLARGGQTRSHRTAPELSVPRRQPTLQCPCSLWLAVNINDCGV